MVSPDYLAIALRKGRVMTVKLEQLLLGDFVLGFDVQTQLPAFSKLILWSEANYSVSTKYLLITLEDGTQLKVKGDQLIIVEGEPIIIKPIPEVDETLTETDENAPETAETKSETDETKSEKAERKSKRAERRSKRAERKSKRAERKSKTDKTKTGDEGSGIVETTPLITEEPPGDTDTPPDIIIPTSNIVMTRTVKPGDSLYRRNVGYVKVTSVKKIAEKGFCRPITANGTILVNNIAISCYHNMTELYIKEKHIISAQMKGRVGYAPLLLYRKLFTGDVGPLQELNKPHTYGLLVSFIFGGKRSAPQETK
jgi:hypothetical protein